MIIFSPILRTCCRILSVALYAVTFAGAFGGFIPPSTWALPSMMVLIFPYMLILSVIVATGWLLSGRLMMAILGGATAIVCWPVGMNSCPMAFSSQPESPSFSLMTYNAYWLIDYQNDTSRNLSRTLSYIIEKKADIVCLQELDHLPRKNPYRRLQTDTLNRIYPYVINGFMYQGAMTPFMLLSRYPAEELKIPVNLSADAALYRIMLPGAMELHVLNVHLTSYLLSGKERNVISDIKDIHKASRSIKMDSAIYRKLSTAFSQREALTKSLRRVVDSVKGPMIICGDFNDVPGSYAYRTLAGDDFKDAIAQTTFGPIITYNAHGFLFHIDQILYRGSSLTPHITLKGTLRSSDHYPVITTFSYDPYPQSINSN